MIETRPQGNGNADTSGTQDPLIKATSTPRVTGPDPIAGADLTAYLDVTTAADDQSDSEHSERHAADLTSQAGSEQQAEQSVHVQSHGPLQPWQLG